jgi:hypothetical protein
MDYATTGTHGLLSRRIAEELTRDKLKTELCRLLPDEAPSKCFTLCDTLFESVKYLKINSAFIIRYSKGEIDRIINIDNYLDEKDKIVLLT